MFKLLHKWLFQASILTLVLGSYPGCISKEAASTQPIDIPLSSKNGFLEKVYYPPDYVPAQKMPRSLASTTEAENPYLVFYQMDPKNPATTERLTLRTPLSWQSMQNGGRLSFFLQMYYANTRTKSNRGLVHQVCFTGSPDQILSTYFSTSSENNQIAEIQNLRASPSTDARMIGFQFKHKETNWEFRLVACRGVGKGTLISQEALDRAIAQVEQNSRTPLPPSENLPPPTLGNDSSVVTNSNEGFLVRDPLPKRSKLLPQFRLRADYDKRWPTDMPWLKDGVSIYDLSRENDAMDFALLLQKYVYENMATQNVKNPDANFIPPKDDKNKKRYFCHMPWLNQGPNGREGIHGLTQERNLKPSPVWPNAPLGSDWGVAMFNSVACETIEKVFGTAQKPKEVPDWSKVAFDDGAVVFKILFTTAEMPEIKDAFTWMANVSVPFSNVRKISPVRHIQMDIAIKDKRLKGLVKDANDQPAASGWVMLTYYYDEKYTPTQEYFQKLPGGFQRMRPVGIATGFSTTPGDSIIFPGAITNHSEGMLNGPADNTKSSCMGCHGVAGTKVGMVPGVTSTFQWQTLLKEQPAPMDFGQQFALAKANYETKPKK